LAQINNNLWILCAFSTAFPIKEITQIKQEETRASSMLSYVSLPCTDWKLYQRKWKRSRYGGAGFDLLGVQAVTDYTGRCLTEVWLFFMGLWINL